MGEKLRTYGAEIEKPIANSATGLPHGVSQDYFCRLEIAAKARGTFKLLHISDLVPDIILGVNSTDLGEQGLDNGVNLLETALPYQHSLRELQQLMFQDMNVVQQALKQEGASVINFSIHPLGGRDPESYKTYVVPKGVYKYLKFRGWEHAAGIDARAQNSPATGVSADEAAQAVSVIIGTSAATVALFGNSPYEEGRKSEFKEARLASLWNRMMRNSKCEGDRLVAGFPAYRFDNMAQYFQWMFGGKTGIHFVGASQNQGEYKYIGDKFLIIPGNPSVLEYLSTPEWNAVPLNELLTNPNSPQTVKITPNIAHMVAMQFAIFTGARIRYSLDCPNFPLADFLQACNEPDSRRVEGIFSKHATNLYIEGRDAGANFPDRELLEHGNDLVSSVMIAPSAIQAGLINNLTEAYSFVRSYPWEQLKALREAAIKEGLQSEVGGEKVSAFTQKVIDIAAKGLTMEEQRMLRYPEFVLETNKNGADRAIDFIEESGKPSDQALKDLIISRQAAIEEA